MTADIPAVPESIPVTDALTLIAIDERYVSDLHQLVVKNQRWLQQSLSWPAEVRNEDETRRHVQGNVMLHQRDYAKMFLLFLDKQLVGVLSFNQIEPQNKTAYIGYWIDEEHQGQGLLSRSLQAFIRHYGAPVCDQMPGGEHPQQPGSVAQRVCSGRLSPTSRVSER